MKVSKILVISFLILGLTSIPYHNDLLSHDNNLLTEGRAGPDAQVTSILSPRATTIDSITGEQLHTLQAGNEVDFEVYIENVGDTDIEEMGVSLTVYFSENGARGMIAKDSAGNDLSWTNEDVVCDDAFVCPWSTLSAGYALNHGRYTMSHQGSPATWIPDVGDYIIVVETNALGDSDPGNDYSENIVSVVDWTDIIVDLAWDSGKEVEGGAGDKAFTLTVETGGSSSWSARSITVEIDVQGALSSAVDNNGNDIMGTTTIAEFGTYGVTETFRHEIDSSNSTSNYRYVLNFQDQSEWFGVVSPDTSGDSGDYSITVNVVSYVVYGQLPECEETQQNGTGQVTYIHFCEVTFYQDGDASTSEDEIEGKVQTFHDIGVTNLVINQGYTVDENGNAMAAPTISGITQGPLNPAWSSVQASVRHMGSDLFVTYDWEVTFEIENTVTGVTETQVADSCTFGQGAAYSHLELGDDMGQGGAAEMGEACIMFEFTPGIYNVTAIISMVGGTAGTADMNGDNDHKSIEEIYAFNNRPSVSLSVAQEPGSIIIGPEGLITLEAVAYDFDDITGQSLNYVWTHPGMQDINGTEQPSQCNGVGPAFSTCNLLAFNSQWAGVSSYTVTVIDEFGSTAMDYEYVFVWNHVVATATTASGIGVEYNLTYDGVNEFTVATWADSGASYTQDLTEFGYAGEYSSVAVVDYSPSTTYMPPDVKSQEITITYDASSIEPTAVFWISNGYWVQLDATITSAGSSGTITVDLGENSQVLPQGEIALMGGELQIVERPDAYPVSLSVYPIQDGGIQASWSYAGITIPGSDWLKMQICDSSGNCIITQENTTLVSHTLSGQTDTVHGETYTYTLQVCNIAGCNPIVATASATADHNMQEEQDSDDDGVSDSQDNCAGTLAGTIVDDLGCPYDFDNDGISYLYDDCPNTPNGIEVDEYGCPLDDDQDGVANFEDDCPNTTSGVEVDNNGCPTDIDQDGYLNSIDDCPDVFGTSNKGLDTNRKIGCPDSDGDGWADTIDAFPNDSAEWLDTDGDGCGDNFDAVPQDPEECLDSDEDGYGDNSDLFPDDPKEFADKDGDGIGDSVDKCESSSGEDVAADGCPVEDEASMLIVGLISGVIVLLIIVIGLMLVIMRKGSKSSNTSPISVYHDDSLFDDNPVMEITSTEPMISETGQISSDGYEWLEHPQGSGNWYWRNGTGTPWTKHENQLIQGTSSGISAKIFAGSAVLIFET